MPNQKNLDGVSDKDLRMFLDSTEIYPFKHINFDELASAPIIRVPRKKRTFWGKFKQRVKDDKLGFSVFCMQMFWPLVILGYILYKQLGG